MDFARHIRPALFACAFAFMLLALACLAGCDSSNDKGGSNWNAPYYDAAGFSNAGDRITYAEGFKTFAKTGIDVSENQGFIDWDAVAADGIDFAFIRVGYRGTDLGGISVDDYAEYNLEAAPAAGIQCGAYFFSQAISVEEAQEEAAFVLKVLGGMDLAYPIAFDYEVSLDGASRAQDVTSEEATAIALAFCQAIEAGGYDAIIYGNAYDLDLYDLSELSRYPLWYAEYGSYPAIRRACDVWQYSNGGTVAGIDAAVDMDLDLIGA